MFFFFGGSFDGLPPSLRRFINGTFFGLILAVFLLLQFRAPLFFYLGLFLAPLIGLSFALRTPQPPDQRRRTLPFDGRFDRDFDYQANARADQLDQRPLSPAADAADRALRLAGYDPESVRVQLEDIGLLVYAGGREPKAVARLEAVQDSASHIRPFIRVRSPLGYSTKQRITFELTDAAGAIFYRSTEEHTVDPGINLIAPNTWLPLANLNPHGHWILQVLLGQTRLALHPFRWRSTTDASGGATFSRASEKVVLHTDGELSSMRAASARLRSDPLSLEELLADQELNPEQNQTRTRSTRRSTE